MCTLILSLPPYRLSFDIVLCADCLFFEDVHGDLLDVCCRTFVRYLI
jgi:hypothetical protein